YHQDETTMLKELDLAGDVDLGNGRIVSDIDFSTRNVWSMRYNEYQKKLFWIGDEKNDEIINLYSLDTGTKETRKYTDVPYIYGWRWNPSGEEVAYVARLGHMEERLGEVRVVNLETGEERVICQDTPEMRFTWTAPSWHPEGRGVVVSMLKDADRNLGNVAYVSVTSGDIKILTDTSKPRSFPSILKDWLSRDEFLYTSNEDGFRNLYLHNLYTGDTKQITEFRRDQTDVELIQNDGKTLAFVVLSNPIENEVVLVDPKSGEEMFRMKVDVNVSTLDTEGNRLLVSTTSGTSKFQIDEWTVTESGVGMQTRVDVPADLKEKIVHAKQERVEFPTFDVDPNTNKTRMLHGFLYVPEKPLPRDQQVVMIQSFYGGGNYYSTRTQILAEAGIYVFSPSPRGSRGFGREFAALNDKDLGGNEIIDIIYAARYVSEKLGIPPERVGCYGGSHGGYATMRLLTFPGEVNGIEADFDWGFGISHAGFSDIIQFYEFCNIPDWVILEAGDPKTEADKLKDRSPIYHADKGRGKLLLTHGTNDSRVPIEGSRAMAASLREHGKGVELIEFEGQGHGIKGLENNVRNYNVWFLFLESLPTGDEDRALN
ncbi:MAG: prolyl oligopeptidase family serine peptidase, partial [bacterium]|nr:prolyl oligopeptidase family serine peptidase [bacterium]